MEAEKKQQLCRINMPPIERVKNHGKKIMIHFSNVLRPENKSPVSDLMKLELFLFTRYQSGRKLLRKKKKIQGNPVINLTLAEYYPVSIRRKALTFLFVWIFTGENFKKKREHTRSREILGLRAPGKSQTIIHPRGEKEREVLELFPKEFRFLPDCFSFKGKKLITNGKIMHLHNDL